MILLCVHPRDVAQLIYASRSTRRLFWNDDVGVAERHLLRFYSTPWLSLEIEEFEEDEDEEVPEEVSYEIAELLETPFRRLPLAYALAAHDWNFLYSYVAVNDRIEFLDALPRRWLETRAPSYEKDTTMTLIEVCVQYGSYRVLPRLLQTFAEEFPSLMDLITTAFLSAAECNNVSLWEFLLERYPTFDMNAKGTSVTFSKTTALECWAFTGNTTMVRHLLSHAAGSLAFAERRDSALGMAAFSGSVETVEALLDAGANVDSTGLYRNTPLQLAAGQSHVEIIKLLVACGADFTTESGETPLFNAARGGHIAAMRTLLDLGADPNVWVHRMQYTGYRKCCLDDLGYASSKIFPLTAIPDFIAIVDELVVRAPDLVRKHSVPVLGSAKHPELIKCLVRHGADVNATNFNPKGLPSLLHMVLAEKRCFHPDNSLRTNKLVEAFVSLGADVHVRNSLQQTPLIVISRSKYRNEAVPAAKILVDAGADVDAVDAEGRSAKEFLHADDLARNKDEFDERSVELYDIPFRRLPFAYALAAITILGRKDQLSKAFNLLVWDGVRGIRAHYEGSNIGPPRESTWSERFLRKAVQLELLDPALPWAWKNLHFFAAVHDLVEFLDILPRKWHENAYVDVHSKKDYVLILIKAAVQYGSCRVLMRLLDSLVETFASLAKDVVATAFLSAAECNNVNLWEVLLERYPTFDLNAKGSSVTLYSTTTLECWSRSGNATMVRHLLSHMAGSPAFAEGRNSALGHAAFSGSVETAEALLNAGADVNSRILEIERETPLLLAARQGHVEMIKLLVARGADVVYHSTLAAASRGHTTALGTLMELDADPEVCTFSAIQCLNHLGSAAGRIFPLTPIPAFVAIVNEVVARAPDILRKHSRAVLKSAMHPELIRCFVRHGADVNARDPDTNRPPTLLHLLLEPTLCFEPRKRLRTRKLLETYVSLGADVNVRNSLQQTPLILLSLCEHRKEAVSSAKILIDAGADVDAVDAEGRSAKEFLQSVGLYSD
ncbi:hypothetical protein HDU96_008086 [Phlyctochytrium bullatum]|nr:hypothetical protein HDU96_008086 [Phlyctochytrium bullatum]